MQQWWCMWKYPVQKHIMHVSTHTHVYTDTYGHTKVSRQSSEAAFRRCTADAEAASTNGFCGTINLGEGSSHHSRLDRCTFGITGLSWNHGKKGMRKHEKQQARATLSTSRGFLQRLPVKLKLKIVALGSRKQLKPAGWSGFVDTSSAV